MQETYFTDDPRFNAYFLNMLRANGNPRRGTELYDQVYGAAASGFRKNPNANLVTPAAGTVEKPANLAFIAGLSGPDGGANRKNQEPDLPYFIPGPGDPDPKWNLPNFFDPPGAQQTSLTPPWKNEKFMDWFLWGLDPRARNKFAPQTAAASGNAIMANGGIGSGIPEVDMVEPPDWLKEQGASPAGRVLPGNFTYRPETTQAADSQEEQPAATAEDAERQLRRHISEGRYGLVLSILGHSRGREALEGIGVNVDGIAEEAEEERLKQEQRDARFRQGLLGEQESGNAPASGSELFPTPAYAPGAEPDDFLMHLDYMEEQASPAYPSEGGQPRETTERGEEPETGEEVFLKAYRDYLIYKAEHPMMDQIGYKGIKGLAFNQLMSRITLADEKDLDAIAEIIGIEKNRLIADKNRLAERTGRFSGQTLNAAPAISPVPGPDSASADEFLSRVKQEIPHYLQQLGALAASGQYSAANRNEILAEYTGLSRLMMMGKDDPYAQFYAEELKPYGYDPVMGFSTLEENARRVGTAIYTIDQGRQALLRPFFNQIEKRLRSDPDTAVQYIKDNAEKIRRAGLDPDLLTGDVEKQVPVYKAMSDPARELVWMDSQADDGSEGYVSNFIISKHKDLPSGNYIINIVKDPTYWPFNDTYYMLSYITEDGKILWSNLYASLEHAKYGAHISKLITQGVDVPNFNSNTVNAAYLKTVPEDKYFQELMKFGMVWDIDQKRFMQSVLTLPRSAYVNAWIALLRGLHGKEQGWIPNAGWREYSAATSDIFGVDTAAEIEKAGFLGRTANSYVDMFLDPLFWIGGGFGIRAGLRSRAAATPGTMENSWARLGVGYSRDLKGLYNRWRGRAPDDVLYSRYATPYGKLPDEAFGIYNEGAGGIGNFKTIKGIDDFKSRIPSNAKELPWRNIEGGASDGIRYRWTDAEGNVWNVRAHSIDPSAPIGSNASKGWVYRVEVRWRGTGKKYFMDSSGNFHPENVLNPSSPMYNEIIANDTHIIFVD